MNCKKVKTQMMKKNYFEPQSKVEILSNKLSYIINYILFISYVSIFFPE